MKGTAVQEILVRLGMCTLPTCMPHDAFSPQQGGGFLLGLENSLTSISVDDLERLLDITSEGQTAAPPSAPPLRAVS